MKGSGGPAAHATRWITPVRIRGRGVKRDGLRRMFGSFAGKRGDMKFGVPREEEKDGGGGRKEEKRKIAHLAASQLAGPVEKSSAGHGRESASDAGEMISLRHFHGERTVEEAERGQNGNLERQK